MLKKAVAILGTGKYPVFGLKISFAQYERFLPFCSLLCVVLLLGTLLFGCASRKAEEKKVTFIVRLHNGARGPVYLTGNTQNLGTWQTKFNLMRAVSDSTRQFTLSFPEETDIQFKITAGSWAREALDASGVIYNNFRHRVRRDTTLYVDAYGWLSGPASITKLAAGDFMEMNRLLLRADWKYHPGDDTAWASASYNDSGWPDTDLDQDLSSIMWNGTGWFRLHIRKDESLMNKTLAVIVKHLGACEVYANGKKIVTAGRIGKGPADAVAAKEMLWRELTPDTSKKIVFAVRYANYDWHKQLDLGFDPSFFLYLRSVNSALRRAEENISLQVFDQLLFSLIPLILFFLHLLLYSFYPRHKQNLFYAIGLLGFAGITFLNYERAMSEWPAVVLLCYRLNNLFIMLAMFFGLLTLYSLNYTTLPKRWRAFCIAAVAVSLYGYFLPNGNSRDIIYLYFGLMMVDIILTAMRHRKSYGTGGRIMVAGFYILSVFIILQILIDYGLIPPLFGKTQVFVYGVLGQAVGMSVFLAYNLATINKDLEKQLGLVRSLSENALHQERQAAKLELERRLLDAENERKSKELESARQLQLSLLPAALPHVQGLEFASYMKTATEVGGDYYDFFAGGQDEATIAIGDATGHGLRAGNMVIAVKGLLAALAHTPALDAVLRQANNALKQMNLKMLMMGLALVRIKNGLLTYSSAGMPPVLLYRAESNTVEQLLIKAMPLGAVKDFPYSQTTVPLRPDDVVLLASDGLYELFNGKKELYGIDRVTQSLCRHAALPAEKALRAILADSAAWAGDAPLEDDVTMIVIKAKSHSAPERVIS